MSRLYISKRKGREPFVFTEAEYGNVVVISQTGNVETSSLKTETLLGEKNKPVLPQTTISSVSITNASGVPLDDLALGEDTFLTLNGTGFESGAVVVVNKTATSTTFVSSTQVRAQFLNSQVQAGTHSVYVINPNGSSARKSNSVTWSLFPAWSTVSGTLDPVTKSHAFSRNLALATPGDSALTYSLQIGALPPGTSLSPQGTLTGNIVDSLGDSTLYSFTVKAQDAELQDTPKSFLLMAVP